MTSRTTDWATLVCERRGVRLLLDVLPSAPARVAELGCGTGTLTRLLTDAGYGVGGFDFSPEMIRRARVKVPEAQFVVGDAASPALDPR
ncbi:class I SAM-dependent methyltransferase [Ornithinimicrobium sp. LYQ121]|uniref:class I SAM-dependent methyltransferase n=1 Tax=Ornithinimicrobium sp. LYQ121 TaxID=3378801 RepID=UPI003851B353